MESRLLKLEENIHQIFDGFVVFHHDDGISHFPLRRAVQVTVVFAHDLLGHRRGGLQLLVHHGVVELAQDFDDVSLYGVKVMQQLALVERLVQGYLLDAHGQALHLLVGVQQLGVEVVDVS